MGFDDGLLGREFGGGNRGEHESEGGGAGTEEGGNAFAFADAVGGHDGGEDEDEGLDVALPELDVGGGCGREGHECGEAHPAPMCGEGGGPGGCRDGAGDGECDDEWRAFEGGGDLVHDVPQAAPTPLLVAEGRFRDRGDEESDDGSSADREWGLLEAVAKGGPEEGEVEGAGEAEDREDESGGCGVDGAGMLTGEGGGREVAIPELVEEAEREEGGDGGHEHGDGGE